MTVLANNAQVKGAYMYKLFAGVFAILAFSILCILNSFEIRLAGLESLIFYSLFLTTIYKLWKAKPKDTEVVKKNVKILSIVVFVIITIFLFSAYNYDDYPSVDEYIIGFLIWPTCVFLWWISSKIIKNFNELKGYCREYFTLKNYLILLATISTIAVIIIACALI